MVRPSRWRIPNALTAYGSLDVTLWLFVRQHFRNGRVFWPHEMSGEILRELRVGLRARDGLLRVLRMLLARTGKRDQRRRKFHLCVISLQCGAAKLNRFLDHGVTVHDFCCVGMH